MITASMAKVGLSLTALFLLGGVSGFSIAHRRMSNSAVRALLEDRWSAARRQEDAARLKLTPEQAEQVRPLYQEMLSDIRAVRESAASGVVEAVKKQGRAMWAHLTPEQRQEFLRLSEERRMRLEKKTTS
jgi:Spy/CpxP family protein refolding chaperone